MNGYYDKAGWNDSTQTYKPVFKDAFKVESSTVIIKEDGTLRGIFSVTYDVTPVEPK